MTSGGERADPRRVLREAGLAPKKSFGQNFLVSPHAVDAIARACVPEAEVGRAVVVEIGAGTGVLTAALLERARRVVGVERDRDLVPLLRATFAGAIARGALDVQEADAKRVDLGALLGAEAPRVLAGNLPYQLTGPLLERCVQNARVMERAVVMVQAEVAARLLAAPGGKEYGALTVFVRAAFDVTRVLAVSRGSFYPAPEVDSAVVALVPRAARIEETGTFRALVRAAFGARRKTLRNAWKGVAPREVLERAAEAAGVSLGARGETLLPEDFARVAASLPG